MPDLSIPDFMARMAAALVPEKAVGINATIQLKLTGAQAADWFAIIQDSRCTLTEGLSPAATLTVSADSGDFIRIFTGQLDGMQAFMLGKLKVAGDLNLAMKLVGLFKMK
jgi:putative sterol carrier protein